MNAILNIADLCSHFDVDLDALWFQNLNRRIYKATECGASISVCGTLSVLDVPEPERAKRIERANVIARGLEYSRILGVLTAAYGVSRGDRSLIEAADVEFHEGKPARLIAWARTIVPDAFPDLTPPERLEVVFHNGHREPIPASFVLGGFTIQSIVEGSDAEVNSDLFRVGTTPEEVNNWIVVMESQVDDLWREANPADEEVQDV